MYFHCRVVQPIFFGFKLDCDYGKILRLNYANFRIKVKHFIDVKSHLKVNGCIRVIAHHKTVIHRRMWVSGLDVESR
jgi:hypothetical protein